MQAYAEPAGGPTWALNERGKKMMEERDNIKKGVSAAEPLPDDFSEVGSRAVSEISETDRLLYHTIARKDMVRREPRQVDPRAAVRSQWIACGALRSLADPDSIKRNEEMRKLAKSRRPYAPYVPSGPAVPPRQSVAASPRYQMQAQVQQQQQQQTRASPRATMPSVQPPVDSRSRMTPTQDVSLQPQRPMSQVQSMSRPPSAPQRPAAPPQDVQKPPKVAGPYVHAATNDLFNELQQTLARDEYGQMMMQQNPTDPRYDGAIAQGVSVAYGERPASAPMQQGGAHQQQQQPYGQQAAPGYRPQQQAPAQYAQQSAHNEDVPRPVSAWESYSGMGRSTETKDSAENSRFPAVQEEPDAPITRKEWRLRQMLLKRLENLPPDAMTRKVTMYTPSADMLAMIDSYNLTQYDKSKREAGKSIIKTVAVAATLANNKLGKPLELGGFMPKVAEIVDDSEAQVQEVIEKYFGKKGAKSIDPLFGLALKFGTETAKIHLKNKHGKDLFGDEETNKHDGQIAEREKRIAEREKQLRDAEEALSKAKTEAMKARAEADALRASMQYQPMYTPQQAPPVNYAAYGGPAYAPQPYIGQPQSVQATAGSFGQMPTVSHSAPVQYSANYQRPGQSSENHALKYKMGDGEWIPTAVPMDAASTSTVSPAPPAAPPMAAQGMASTVAAPAVAQVAVASVPQNVAHGPSMTQQTASGAMYAQNPQRAAMGTVATSAPANAPFAAPLVTVPNAPVTGRPATDTAASYSIVNPAKSETSAAYPDDGEIPVF